MRSSNADFAAHLADLQQRVQALTQAMTQADKSQFVQALLAGIAERFELVRQEDLEALNRQLQRACDQIEQLEARLAGLESPRKGD